MKLGIFNIFHFILTAAAILFFYFEYQKKNSVAYVKSQIVLEKYKGMEEARVVFENKVGKWKSNIDSLEFIYNNSLQKYSAESSKIESSKKAEVENQIKKQAVIAEQYAKSMEAKAQEENEKLTQGVLNQVNDFIKKYAEKNGYDIVLGVTLSGNILYGSDAIDITDEVLEGLNTEYEGKK
jgi:outer membrane protein